MTNGARADGLHRRVPWVYPDDLRMVVGDGRGPDYEIRAVRPDDAALLVRFHDELVSPPIDLRYFTAQRKLCAPEVERLTRFDYVTRLGLAAVRADRFLALARYEREPDTTGAEIALAVAPPARHDVAARLLDELAAAAFHRGIRRFVADAPDGGGDIIDLIAASGYPVEIDRDGRRAGISFSIDPSDRLPASSVDIGNRSA